MKPKKFRGSNDPAYTERNIAAAQHKSGFFTEEAKNRNEISGINFLEIPIFDAKMIPDMTAAMTYTIMGFAMNLKATYANTIVDKYNEPPNMLNN